MRKISSILLLLLLAACAPAGVSLLPTETPVTPDVPRLVMTDTATPPAVSNTPVTLLPANATATPSASETETAATDSSACLNLLSPADGATLAASGHVTFRWQSWSTAQYYVLTLILPTGIRETSLTSDLSLTRFVKPTEEAEVYRWTVTAYDAESQPICESSVFAFSKPASVQPTGTPTRTMVVIPPVQFTPTMTHTFIVIPTISATPPGVTNTPPVYP